MKRNKIIVMGMLLLITAQVCHGQDPNFSQFFSSPLNINPALTANINSDWRMISNFRSQWIGPANPYITGTISYDKKVFQDKMAGVEEKNIWGMGGMVMFDYAMAGAVRSTYASFDLSYNLKLAGNEVVHRLGAGFGATYGNRFVDFSSLTFQEQFTGTGFNTSLPTGEAALADMKPYFSGSFGLLYSITGNKSNFDFGISTFHFNKPKQTFLYDEHEYLPMRNVVHANFETYLNEGLLLNTNAIYQQQGGTNYYSVGGALGFVMPNEKDVMVHTGLWYWSANSLTPYFGLTYGDFQFGLSYDFTVSKLREAPKQANTFEFSFILRGQKSPGPRIPCPWK